MKKHHQLNLHKIIELVIFKFAKNGYKIYVLYIIKRKFIIKKPIYEIIKKFS